MTSEKKNKSTISRKKFLNICGSLLAGGSLIGVTGSLLRNSVLQRKKAAKQQASGVKNRQAADSPYRLVSSFRVPGNIDCFEACDDKLVVAAANSVYIYNKTGTLLGNFMTGSHVRDIKVSDGLIYVLFPSRIETYTMEGECIRDWETCSPESDYCQFAVTPDFVFVTDAANKIICKYTTEGNFVGFIQSPNGFIIPSYTFGITYVDGSIYCSNPGRHQVEKYTVDGTYIGAFGKAGGAPGMFCGCCNPVRLSSTANGDIITSEKGNPRISCYAQDGQFRSILLDSDALGGGNTAYSVRVQKDKIHIAGKNMVSTFRYDKILAAKTSCSKCKANCPLRAGIEKERSV